MVTPEIQCAKFRQFWKSGFTFDDDFVEMLGLVSKGGKELMLDSRDSFSVDRAATVIEGLFWNLAGFADYAEFPLGPPVLPGLLDLAIEILEKYVKPTPEGEPEALWSSQANRRVNKMTAFAMAGGRMSEEFFRQIVRTAPHLWTPYRSSDWDRRTFIDKTFNGVEPNEGSPEHLQLEAMVKMAGYFQKIQRHAMETLDEDFLPLVSGHYGYHRASHLLQACLHLQRLNPVALPEQFRKPIATLAGSEITGEELLDPALGEQLNQFDTPVLLWVEQYQNSARPVLHQVLSHRPGALQLVHLKDRIYNELYSRTTYGHVQLTPDGGFFRHKEILEQISAIPPDLYGTFRQLLTSHDSYDPGSFLKKILLILDAVQGLNEKAIAIALKSHGQAALKAFALLPLPDKGPAREREVHRRYAVIQDYAKTSKKYGTERHTNNLSAASVAMQNLAIHAGYEDSDHLFFDIETALMEKAGSLRFVSGVYEVALSVQSSGPCITVHKSGIELKAIPASLKKLSDFKKLKEHHSLLQEQRRRFGRALEQKMATSSTLASARLAGMCKHPVLSALLTSLVFVDGSGHSGMLDPGTGDLIGVNGVNFRIQGERVTIAHPVMLHLASELEAWRQRIFDLEIIQPFRQVFREFYVATGAELGTSPFSSRFAGHLLSGSRLAALMKSRSWNTAGTDGPEPKKKFAGPEIAGNYDLVECGHFLSETDTVTTGTVFFSDPLGAKIDIGSVPPPLFSEVMRDIDLFVSAAQTSQDGATSAAMIQQRLEVVGSVLKKLKLQGVSFEGNHAVVEGQRTTYRIHLASGGVIMGPGNHLCIVPASHWKPPTKTFLPFSDDDDWKISEVFSKILMLSADYQIKDPVILSQLNSALG